MKVINRIYDSVLQKSLKAPLITVLLGPRQAGKTTSVHMALKNIPDQKKLFLNFDSSWLRDKVLRTEDYLLREIEHKIKLPFSDFTERFYLVIDEAQKLPASFEQIKMLYDQYPEQLKIILTGASSLEIMSKTAETLAGRLQTLHVYPFTMAEAATYLERSDFSDAAQLYEAIFSGKLTKDMIQSLIKIKRPRSQDACSLIKELLTNSLFPPVYSRLQREGVEQWLLDYLDTYVEKDMRSLSDLGNIEGYRKVVQSLAHRVGNLIHYQDLASDTGVNHITIKKYIALWEESYIGYRLQPYFVNPSKRIKKSTKGYTIDNGLVWAMHDFPYLDLLHASGKIGQFFENIIIADFLKYGSILPQRPRFFFWQKSAASEVDLVISSRGQIIPVEIKYSATFQDKMLRGIRTFRKDHTTSGIFIPYSILIYNGEFYCPEENIFCLPAWLFV